MKKLFLLIILATSISVNAQNIPLVSLADVVEPLMPAVVNINTVKYAHKRNEENNSQNLPDSFKQFNELFEKFGIPFHMDEMPTNPKAISLGSGFIIDPEGYIVTNHHVIKDADEVSIKLNNNNELKAKVIGSDAKTDVALLKVNHSAPLPFVKFGDSNISRVGDWVIAIGNPFGLGGTVTSGIISSKSRDIDLLSNSIIDDYIQTDAAINSGNSGGPMFNLNGEVIGVNTAILAPTGTNIGIGFAIPSNTVKKIVADLRKDGKINRGILSIKIQDLTPEIAEGLGISENAGALIAAVDEGGAGDKAGLKAGDIVIEYNSQPIKNFRKLQIMVAETAVNTEVPITVIRNGKKLVLKAKIVDESKFASNKAWHKNGNGKYFVLNDVTLSNITSELADKYNITISQGVVVVGNKAMNEWSTLQKGDVIIAVNQLQLSNLQEFEKTYENIKKSGKKNLVLLVKRGSVNLFVALPIL